MANKKRARRLKKPPTAPNPAFFPASRKWMLDYDYTRDLSPKEQAWLAQFSDEYYRADSRYAEPFYATAEERRERYHFQNVAQRDIFTRTALSGHLVYQTAETPNPDKVADTLDFVPSPQYLELPEYREAREEFRRLVDKDERTSKDVARLEMLQAYLLSIHESGVKE